MFGLSQGDLLGHGKYVGVLGENGEVPPQPQNPKPGTFDPKPKSRLPYLAIRTLVNIFRAFT